MRSVLIDSNLLILLIVGLYDKELIASHKRTRDFTPGDFDLLVEHIDGYEKLWITSHCLAEVSNLIRQTNTRQAEELMVCLSQFVAAFKESHMSKGLIFNDDISTRLGVTDTGLIIKSKNVTCTYTTDLNLYLEISKRGYDVVNFNHLRDKAWKTRS